MSTLTVTPNAGLVANSGSSHSQQVAERIEQVLIGGDLSKLSPTDRLLYYNRVCESLGLNPLTKPFAYLRLNGKEVLYALKDATEQLRKIHGVSITEITSQRIEDVFVVTAKAQDKTGRTDAATGAVAIANLKGEALANALMKAETKAKRRVTLSICGLGMLDETEVDSIPQAQVGEPLPPVVIEVAPEPAIVEGLPPESVLIVKTEAAQTSRGKAYWLLTTHLGEQIVTWEAQLGAYAEQVAQNKEPVFLTVKGEWDGKRVVKAMPRATIHAPEPAEKPIHELSAAEIPF